MMKRPGPWHRNATSAGALSGYEDIRERAERLGITSETVLLEYRRIGFADIRKIVTWTKEGMEINLDCDDAAAVLEIVTSASTGKPYRVKFHDRTPVLAALARCIGMPPAKPPVPNDDDMTDDDGESAREFLAREVARLRAGGTGE